MSLVNIKAALETALNSITPSMPTFWENMSIDEPLSLPMQQVFLITMPPANPEYGQGYQERGFIQVSLRYPLKSGSGEAIARAEVIRSHFKRGFSFSFSGDVVTISETPSITASVTLDHYFLAVKIPFYSNQLG